MATLRDLQETIRGGLRLGADLSPDARETTLGAVVTDSRKAGPGDLFWPLVGSRHDGAEFAHDAFEAGAAGAVVSRPVEPPGGRWVLRVDDTQQALEQWAGWNRPAVPRHGDRRHRQRGQEHQPADDLLRPVQPLVRHGQPAELQQLHRDCPI